VPGAGNERPLAMKGVYTHTVVATTGVRWVIAGASVVSDFMARGGAAVQSVSGGRSGKGRRDRAGGQPPQPKPLPAGAEQP
jgi:hypothetical protein